MHIPTSYFHYRVDPSQGYPEDRERFRHFYRGRRWRLRKDQAMPFRFIKYQQRPKKAFFNTSYLEKALKLLQSMTTLEEKAAQLCLYETAAVYDAERQHETLKLILGWHIGGLVFDGGELRRQDYLIQQYQESAKVPLLIGNDFVHGLSFYFGDEPFAGSINSLQLADLGKAVVGLNRGIRVDFQFDRERGTELFDNTEEFARLFRRGIKQARGLVARTTPQKQLSGYTTALSTHLSSQQQQRPEIKSLSVLDLTRAEISESVLLEALRKGEYHLFLCSDETIRRVITLMSAAVMKGKISEQEIDKHVLQLLYLKVRLEAEKQ